MSSAITWNGISLDWAYSDLLSHIRFKVACPHRAKDVLHDALIRFVVSPSQHRHEQPHAYLRSIVQNLVNDDFHRKNRLLSLDTQFNSTDDFGASTELLADMRQRLMGVQTIIEHLPSRCRQVFWLYRIEGYTQPEIADQLGISKNMVERHVMRAIIDLSYVHEKMMAE